MTRSLSLGFALALGASTTSYGQDTGAPPGGVTEGNRVTSEPLAVPFYVGERLAYDVKFGALRVGSGSMEVAGVEDIRGRETWHTVFRIKGGTFFYKVNDVLESWFDRRTFASLRHVQDFEEGGRNRERRFEIYPSERRYVEERPGREPHQDSTVAQPLDDGSFLYFVRTVPLAVGQTYTFHRYFRPDRNPVTIRVLRREQVKVPAGTFDAVVIQPIIKAKGIFSENGEAEIWLSDDDRRMMLQMKSRLSFGSLNLYLRSYTQPRGTTATP
ncbi:MAG TPA: DUF3108 domain-containing protein [Gemmatimonadaceae bacterium]|nr:DUF3108 domain-containing protein [Gemmatimonadaceae bacterium]